MNYEEFVASRVKPGADIVSTLTPEKAHLLHMAIGLVGEVIEVAYAETPEHQKEEAGDIEFYYQGFLLDPVLAMAVEAIDLDTLEDKELGEAAGDVLDTVKKYVIYNKPVFAEIAVKLATFRLALNDSLEYHDLLVEDLQKSNTEKLTKRYPTGYTDAAAQARADKKEGE